MKHLLLGIGLSFCCIALCAQQKNSKHYFSPHLKIKKIGWSVGQDQDMLFGLDHKYLLQTARLNGDIDVSALSESRDYTYSMICENPHTRLELELLLPNRKNTTIVAGLYSITGRIDAAYFNSCLKNLDGAYHDQYLNISSLSNEIGVETALLRYFPLSRGFRFFAGVGTNIGYSYDGELTINARNIDIERNDEVSFRATPMEMDELEQSDDQSYYGVFDQKNGISQRGIGQIGFGITFFSRLEMQYAHRRGYGYRYIADAPLLFTHLNSNSISFRWVLR